ncbi:serine palmitoyltransferase small subunit B isoform X2 [Maylandia zebra]|uniref:serine palmitoyltransferase small subunit B isoform X2 n=1 Tax=Maylandia zebra TaxID=106582 RepID=UPI00403CCF16
MCSCVTVKIAPPMLFPAYEYLRHFLLSLVFFFFYYYFCRMNFKNLREYLAWLYYQYLLITGIYVLEPWEKSIFNSILFSAIAMVVYTSYVFVPIHVRLALEFFLGIFGGQPESTMALMT